MAHEEYEEALKITDDEARLDLREMLELARELYPSCIEDMCQSLVYGAAHKKIDGERCDLCVIGWLTRETDVGDPFADFRDGDYLMRPIEKWVLPVEPARKLGPERVNALTKEESDRRSLLIAKWTEVWAKEQGVLTS